MSKKQIESVKKRGVFVSSEYSSITGSPIRGILLSQLMYWMPRRTHQSFRLVGGQRFITRYIVKTWDELADEIGGMTANAVQKQMKKLAETGLVEYFSATVYGKKQNLIRVILPRLRQMLKALKLACGEKLVSEPSSSSVQIAQKQNAKRRNTQVTKTPNGGMQNAKRRNTQVTKTPNGGIYISESVLSETLDRDYKSSDRGAPSACDDDFLNLMTKLSTQSVVKTLERGVESLQKKAKTGEVVTDPVAYLTQCLRTQQQAEEKAGVPPKTNDVRDYTTGSWADFINDNADPVNFKVGGLPVVTADYSDRDIEDLGAWLEARKNR